jgi:hypothetical protein
MNSLNEKGLDFKSLEQEVFSYVCKLGVEIINAVLSNVDKQLVEERNKEEFRHKGLKRNTIKTIMGSVEYHRAIYETIDSDGNKKYIYLLDELLNMDTIGKMSGTLVEKVLENVSSKSYRKSAQNVSSLTGQSISHGAAWGLVQKFGEKLEKDETDKVERFKKGDLNGTREVDVLFMESDGLWLSMQRKDRPKGVSGKREIKLGIHYEGWEKRGRNGKKETYRIKNKGVVAGFVAPEEFKLLRDANIAETYNYDEIKLKVLNGDGAAWIRNGHDADGDIFQLDRFHIARAIVRNIKDKNEARKLWKMFKNSQYKSFMGRLNELKYECGGVYEEVKKIAELENYIISNKDGVIPYQKRVQLPQSPEGLFYRNMGTMETNVFNVLGNRMKGQKMSWSTKGANHLAKILAAKASGKLYDKISSLLRDTLPQKALEVYETVINSVKENSKKMSKRTKVYPIHEATRPFTGAHLTEGRKAIRRMLDERLITELIYR